MSTPKKTLHLEMSEITISAVNQENLSFLKILHMEIFNLLYQETRYSAVCEGFTMAAYLAYWNDSVVGEIMIDWKVNNGKLLLYISSLGVAEGHRRKGITTHLLSYVKNIAWDAVYVYLHTQENNVAAQTLYRKEGFIPIKRVPYYYVQKGLDAIVFQWTNPSECPPTEHAQVYHLLLWNQTRLHPVQSHQHRAQFRPSQSRIKDVLMQCWCC
jgi:ribosomal protein S18 acetylase RimI-like enzyme